MDGTLEELDSIIQQNREETQTLSTKAYKLFLGVIEPLLENGEFEEARKVAKLTSYICKNKLIDLVIQKENEFNSRKR